MMIMQTNNPCLEYLGAISGNGYGNVHFRGSQWRAHRLVYSIIKGPIPHGTNVLHSCDNPKCINASHLFLGTQKENMQDKINKNRDHNKRKTHCSNGHEFTHENTYKWRNERKCRQCRSTRRKAAMEAQNSSLP